MESTTQLHPLGVEFHIMGTGFTWETQNREADIEAASAVWQESKRMLADPSYDLVVLDELTYMLAYHYLDTQEVIAAIENRPPRQNVIGHRPRLPRPAAGACRYG